MVKKRHLLLSLVRFSLLSCLPTTFFAQADPRFPPDLPPEIREQIEREEAAATADPRFLPDLPPEIREQI